AAEHGVAGRAETVRDSALGLTRDPLSVATPRRYASVDGLGVLEHDVRPPRRRRRAPEKRRDVGGLADRIAIQRDAGRREVAEPGLLRMEVIDVSDVRRRLERDAPIDRDADTPERLDLAR